MEKKNIWLELIEETEEENRQFQAILFLEQLHIVMIKNWPRVRAVSIVCFLLTIEVWNWSKSVNNSKLLFGTIASCQWAYVDGSRSYWYW